MPVQNPSPGQSLAVTAQGGLYLRMGPSTETAAIVGMPFGAIVQATGQENNAFAQVVYNGQTGWASEAYLAAAPQVVQQVAQLGGAMMGQAVQQGQGQQGPVGTVLTIIGQDVALRSAPLISQPDFGQGSNVIVLTNKGETVTTLGPRQNAFTNVSYKGKSGWMSDRYLAAIAGGGSDLAARPPVGQPVPVQPVKTSPATPAQATGTGTFVLGLGILIAVGYFAMK